MTYTKAILTVIALLLAALVMRPAPVHADTDSPTWLIASRRLDAVTMISSSLESSGLGMILDDEARVAGLGGFADLDSD